MTLDRSESGAKQALSADAPDLLPACVHGDDLRRKIARSHVLTRVTEKYFFWSGRGKLESIVRSWQTRLRKLFKLANVPNGHAHRFRDTFAVELLLAGVPIERVSILLGHQSVRITEKHYAPWVRSRQEQLEADLANAWSRDPLVLLESGVHQRYTERSGPTTRSSSIRKTGARGGSRTHMRKNPRRILSPQRLPFRHPGRADKKK